MYIVHIKVNNLPDADNSNRYTNVPRKTQIHSNIWFGKYILLFLKRFFY